MKVKFVGAVNQVTGSCTWLKHNDIQFLVDCGMVQGPNQIFENKKPFLFNPKKIKYVLLTHSHIDHCGLIPRLYKEGFVGKVYCTSATAKLTKEMLHNSAKLDAPYSKKDVYKIKFTPIDEKVDFNWGYFTPIDKDLFVAFYRSSHILGSVSIQISWEKDSNKSIYFSGDIGTNTEENPDLPLLKDRQNPHKKTQYLVCESTYGNRTVEKSDSKLSNRINKLEKLVIDTLFKKRGNLIIPTFSQQRTQELIFDFYYLFQKKWSGRAPFDKFKIPLLDYLISEHNLFKKEWQVSNTGMDKIKEDDKVPAIFIENFDKYYTKLISINEKAYNKITDADVKSLKFQFKDRGKGRSLYQIKEDEKVLKILEDHQIKYFELFTYNGKKLDKNIIEGVQEVGTFPVNLYVHSPLAEKISAIYSEELFSSFYNPKQDKKKFKYLNKEIFKWLGEDEHNTVKVLKKLFLDKKIQIGDHQIIKFKGKNLPINGTPSIVLTSSGMCSGGVVMKYLHRLKNLNDTFALTGFQCKHTNGYKIQNLKDFSDEKKKTYEIDADKETIPLQDIKAEIKQITGYSGHADQEGLLDYIFIDNEKFNYAVPNIFINHGNDDAKVEFKSKILERSAELDNKYQGKHPYKTNVIVPDVNSGWYDLDNNEWIEKSQDENKTVANTNNESDLISAIKELTKEIIKLKDEISELRDQNLIIKKEIH